MKLISLSLLAIILSVTTAANAKTWDFDVYLGDDHIGEHRFVLSTRDGKEVVDIDARFNVKFWFINAYKYQHTNRELWNDGCLVEIDAYTNDNGDEYDVEGKKENGKLTLQINQKEKAIPGCVKSFSYWDQNIVKQNRLLNAQTGDYESVDITKLENESLNLRDRQVESQRYRISAEKFSIDLWYSLDGEWLALRSTTEDGNTLTYKLKKEI